MKRPLSYSILLIFVFVSCIQSSHFFGGSMSWRPIIANVANSSTVTIQLKQTYTWSLSLYPCQAVTGPPADMLICFLNCVGSGGIYVKGICTGFDLGLSVSMSQNLVNLTYAVNTRRILAYQSTQWIPLVSGVKGWSLTVDINLTARSDNGLINSSPTTSMTPLVVVPVNTGQVLRIPMVDADGDIVRCRWANHTAVEASITIDECSGVCQDLPGASLSSSSNLDNNCTLVFNTSMTGYYVIAIQIEDFMPSAPNASALSSIPLQFLVQAVAVTCDAPVIVGDLANGATIQLPANVMFSTPVLAQPGCNESSIDHFLTVTMPAGTASTSTMIALNSTLFSTTLTWTPTLSQIGSTQMYCTVAIDSNNIQSAQYCLNFVVIAPTSSTTSTTSTSTSTTTTASTTTTSTTSVSVYSVPTAVILIQENEHTDLGLLLGLILGLGLPLCLLLSLLASCCCCPQWCARSCCGKIRRQFWDEDDMVCPKCRDQHGHQTANKKAAQQHPSHNYRDEYIQDSSSTRACPRDSSTSRPLSPFELHSQTATTTTWASCVNNPMTPTDLDSSIISTTARTKGDRFGGSFLVRSYSRQMNREDQVSN